MSRRMIGYPTGWTLAVIDEAGVADGLIGDLSVEGLAGDDLVILSRADAAAGLARLGSSTGPVARLRRGLQFLTMDQMPDLHVYELAIDQGRAVIGVRVADAEHRRRVVGVLVRRGAHFINRFGAWATEEIAPWRGPMLDLPQHMRR